MGDCLTKGKTYEKERKIKHDLFMLKMKYMVWGIESLTNKEIRKLKRAGIIKPVRKSRFSSVVVDEENDDEESFTGTTNLQELTLTQISSAESSKKRCNLKSPD